jgi:hypothetical protein
MLRAQRPSSFSVDWNEVTKDGFQSCNGSLARNLHQDSFRQGLKHLLGHAALLSAMMMVIMMILGWWYCSFAECLESPC